MNLSLRPLTDTDIPLFKTWLHRPHVAKWYHDPEDWLVEVRGRESEFSFIRHFIAERGGEPIGFCQYYRCADVEEEWYGTADLAGVYSIDYLLGDENNLGQGLGRAIIKQLAQKVFAIPGARRIIVQPEAENAPSCRALLSAGFSFDQKQGIYTLKNGHKKQ